MAAREGDLRVDARRNRDRILAAARELFRDSSDVPMYEVARRAGVGQATLYRHFPDRFALAEAISEAEFAGLIAVARAHAGDPNGFFAVLRAMSRSLAGLRGITELIRSGATEEARGRWRAETVALFTEPLQTARAAGGIRADLQLEDVFGLLMMIQAAVTDLPDPEGTQAAGARALELLVDGVRGRG